MPKNKVAVETTKRLLSVSKCSMAVPRSARDEDAFKTSAIWAIEYISLLFTWSHHHNQQARLCVLHKLNI